MAIRNSRDKSQAKSSSTPANDRQPIVHSRKKSEARKNFRRSLFETLEDRKLMAVGPQLIGIQPNVGDQLQDGDVRNTNIRELNFKFNDGQVIDVSTINRGIAVTRSGGDGTFGLNSNVTDFGSNGRVAVRLTMRNPGDTLTVNVTKADRGSLGPGLVLSNVANSFTLNIELNTNASARTTANQVVNAINGLTPSTPKINATVIGGFANTVLGGFTGTALPPIQVNRTNDTFVPFLSNSSDAVRQANEVPIRFGDTLQDDTYLIEVLGDGDPNNTVA